MTAILLNLLEGRFLIQIILMIVAF